MRSYQEYLQTASVEEAPFEAAKYGRLSEVISYLQAGGDINIKNSQGHSLLMLAAYHGHSQLTKILLEAGADPNSTDSYANTILMGVCFKGHAEIASLLIHHGADVHALNHGHQNALMYAILFGRHEVIQVLEGNSQIKKIRFHQQVFIFFKILFLGLHGKLFKGEQHV